MQQISNTSDGTGSKDVTLAAQCVRSLLARHGIPQHKHQGLVAEILGLSQSAAYRRLATSATWALEELTAIAAHYGETLTQLVSSGQTDEFLQGVLQIGDTPIECIFRLGPAIQKPDPRALIAVATDTGWRLVTADRRSGLQAYDVAHLIATPPSAAASTSRRIAVLDDHAGSVESLVAYLEVAGFEPTSYATIAAITAAIAAGDFDGYVLDWIIGNETARSLIETIRLRDGRCPIVVLTGEISTGLVSEDDIAEVLRQYQVKFFEKPARPKMIVSALEG
jgi:CheY-like chemotaxis protein